MRLCCESGVTSDTPAFAPLAAHAVCAHCLSEPASNSIVGRLDLTHVKLFCDQCQVIVIMDPLSALSLAANILQFIDFTSKLFAAGAQLHQLGTHQLELDLGPVARDLGDVTRKLIVSLNPPGVKTALTSDDQVGSQ
jgi:hypothetical protein